MQHKVEEIKKNNNYRPGSFTVDKRNYFTYVVHRVARDIIDGQFNGTQEEIDEWKEKDPIPRFGSYCLKNGLLTEEEIEKIKEQGYADIEAARVFAEASPEPDVAALEEGVYAP